MEKWDKLEAADFPMQLSLCLLQGCWCKWVNWSPQPLRLGVFWPLVLPGVIQGPLFLVPGLCRPAVARLMAAEGRLGHAKPQLWEAFLLFPVLSSAGEGTFCLLTRTACGSAPGEL